MDLSEDAHITTVGHVVAALGLVTAFGHVSRRTSASTYEITELGDLATLRPDQVVSVDIEAPTLPPGAPGEAWLHTEIYRARPDVGGIVRAQPESAFAVSAVTETMHPVHGQAAWLGAPVPVWTTPRLVRAKELGVAAAATLSAADALLLRANGAVTVGANSGIAAARMWLLDSACGVWLRAHASGAPAGLDAGDIDAWITAAPPLLQRLWHTMALRAAQTGRLRTV
ncbi:class II aldolase/adducin family protein [Streptomyces mirabilis]|uniref:class II aldolase/adducin family protein n=1 Tax=Streptomyces mirabilis TaxID=68239 RepID=UPI003329A556